MARKNNEYFEAFILLTRFSLDAAENLLDALKDFAPATLKDKMDSLHEIEHRADDEKHAMMEKLVKEFVTPIEREDIIQLANEIDNVTDTVEDVLIRLYMYNVQAMRREAVEMCEVIVRCCRRLYEAMQEFPNFHKSQTLHEAIVDVNTMEEEGDAIYIAAVRRLYTEESDPVSIIAWSETFERLEDCCDACEHVANVMESVVMKNN